MKKEAINSLDGRITKGKIYDVVSKAGNFTKVKDDRGNISKYNNSYFKDYVKPKVEVIEEKPKYKKKEKKEVKEWNKTEKEIIVDGE